MPAQKPCKTCGQAIVLVQAPAGGVIPLEPYPLARGEQSTNAYRVDVVRHGLVLLAAGEPSSSRTRLYERHRCVTARNAVPPPHKRTEQLALDVEG